MPVIDNVQPGVSSAQGVSSQSSSGNDAMSYDEYVRNQGDPNGDGFFVHTPDSMSFWYGDNILANIVNGFIGHKNLKKQEYDMYLQNLNKANEEKALGNARAYDLWLENTRYQRAAADLKAAGLNPWLLVNSGSFSPAGGSAMTNSSAKGAQYDVEESKTKSGLAGLLSAIIKLLA